MFHHQKRLRAKKVIGIRLQQDNGDADAGMVTLAQDVMRGLEESILVKPEPRTKAQSISYAAASHQPGLSQSHHPCV